MGGGEAKVRCEEGVKKEADEGEGKGWNEDRGEVGEECAAVGVHGERERNDGDVEAGGEDVAGAGGNESPGWGIDKG